MEFLYPKAERRHRMLLFIGYGLIAIAISIAAIILFYWSYGYSIDSRGGIKQSGIVFVSSSPDRATIEIDGVKAQNLTNARLQLESGEYQLKLSREGYHSWEHKVDVLGSDVQRYDYAKLFPVDLKTSSFQRYETAPSMASQSPSRRWLLVKDLGTPLTFGLYDFKNPKKTVQEFITIPEDVVTPSASVQSWEMVEWATKDRYALLKRNYMSVEAHDAPSGSKFEYILFDREKPNESKNISRIMSLAPEETVTLFDKQSEAFYIFNAQTGILRTVSIDGTSIYDQLEHVKAFKSYGKDTLLYVTDLPESGKANPGTVNVVLRQGQQRLTLRKLPAAAPGYLLDIARYDDDWHIIVAATESEGAHLYINPLSQKIEGERMPKPARYMRLKNPQFVSFSSSSRNLLIQNGLDCIVYDAELKEVTKFKLEKPIDAPQTVARWMDGARLSYVSGGRLVVVEADNKNLVELHSAAPEFVPFFTPDYQHVFAFAKDKDSSLMLCSTPLLTEADQ